MEKHYCNTRYVECKGSQLWKIKGLLTTCPLKNGECLQSPTFSVRGGKDRFIMKLFPKGDEADSIGVSLFLCVVEGEPLVTYELSLIDISGKKRNKEIATARMNRAWGYSDFISREELWEKKWNLLPDDELTISCVVTILEKTEVFGQCTSKDHDSVGDDDPLTTFTDDWVNFSVRKQNTDVALKVGDKVVLAHKAVLMCRSPIFAAMFDNDMQEKATNEVDITDVEHDALAELVSFMYSDKFSVSDVGLATKLMVAADKYGVASLRRRCSDFLGEQLSANNVFAIFPVADACHAKKLVQRCMDVIKCEMSSVTSITDWVAKLHGSPNLIGLIKEHLAKEQE